MATNVKYIRKGDIDVIELGVAGLEKITIDFTGIPTEQRNGIAKALLSASALSCYVGAISGALEAREAKVDSIEAEAEIALGPNESGQGRVKEMKLATTVNMSESDAPIFDRCVKIMRHGCLITGTLHDGVAMEYTLNSKYEN